MDRSYRPNYYRGSLLIGSHKGPFRPPPETEALPLQEAGSKENTQHPGNIRKLRFCKTLGQADHCHEPPLVGDFLATCGRLAGVPAPCGRLEGDLRATSGRFGGPSNRLWASLRRERVILGPAKSKTQFRCQTRFRTRKYPTNGGHFGQNALGTLVIHGHY